MQPQSIHGSHNVIAWTSYSYNKKHSWSVQMQNQEPWCKGTWCFGMSKKKLRKLSLGSKQVKYT